MADFVNFFLGILTIAAEIISVILVVFWLTGKKDAKFVKWWTDNALLFAFIVALTAMLGSLTYSNVLGYTPCELCWFQRIFMYPQAFLLGIAAYRKEKMMFLYSVVLSSIGACISLYHYLGQMELTTLPCPVVGQSISCAKVFVLQFGYISIPVMAFSAFILIIITSALALKRNAQ